MELTRGEGRGQALSGQGKKVSRREELTRWIRQRKGLVRAGEESELVWRGVLACGESRGQGDRDGRNTERK